MEQVKAWATNRWVQLGTAFLAGALLCTLLYPSTKTETQIKQEYQQIMDQAAQRTDHEIYKSARRV
jgi:hypothetical protein